MTSIQLTQSPIKTQKTVQAILMVAFGVVVLALSAQISIPLAPVPVTLQTMMVILLGISLGPRLATYTACSYLAAGAAGLPIFANFSLGLPVLLGPTGGYLMAFIPAAFIAGYVWQRLNKNVLAAFSSVMLATSIMLAGGIAWLATFIGWHQAIALGFMPFITIEAVKCVIAGVLAKRYGK